MSTTFNVIVVGGGPGGCTAATLVAMQGHRVLLLERESAPVYKIGESLLPATVNGICAMLGVTQELERANFVVKQGGTFRWGAQKEPWTFAFAQSSRMPGPTAFAYQVERLKFDPILLANAKRKGVVVQSGVTVNDLLRNDDDAIAGVVAVDAAGEKQEFRSRFVIDASGWTTVIGRHVGERVYAPAFRNVAVFSYFENGGRLPAPNSGNIFSVAFEHGWCWYIPLSDTLTSVGAVIPHEQVHLLKGGIPQAYEALITACEPVRRLLQGATRVSSGPYSEVRVRKEYSYCQTQFWRPGMALIGDAACFVDPVFSSGVHLATYAGLLAARSINSCLSHGLDEATSFGEFERRYLREYRYFYDFLVAFYNMNEEVHGYRKAAKHVLSSDDEDAEAFIRLVAGLGASDEELVGSAATVPHRMAFASDLLPERKRVVGPDGSSAGGGARFVNALFSEVTQVQSQAMFGTRRMPEQPLTTDGLIPTPDGFHWKRP